MVGKFMSFIRIKVTIDYQSFSSSLLSYPCSTVTKTQNAKLSFIVLEFSRVLISLSALPAKRYFWKQLFVLKSFVVVVVKMQMSPPSPMRQGRPIYYSFPLDESGFLKQAPRIPWLKHGFKSPAWLFLILLSVFLLFLLFAISDLFCSIFPTIKVGELGYSGFLLWIQ